MLIEITHFVSRRAGQAVRIVPRSSASWRTARNDSAMMLYGVRRGLRPRLTPPKKMEISNEIIFFNVIVNETIKFSTFQNKKTGH